MAFKSAGGFGTYPMIGEFVLNKKKSREYKVTNRDVGRKRPLYTICFNLIDSRFYHIFALVGGNIVTVYQCLPEGGALAVLMAFVGEDKEEEFYIMIWAIGRDVNALLVVAAMTSFALSIVRVSSFKRVLWVMVIQ